MLTDTVAPLLDERDVVVQRYIDDPYLIDGRKAHLRIYGLIAGTDPLRAYVYRDGIVRFAPEPFERRPGWLDRIDMHVTNTALHRGHPGLTITRTRHVTMPATSGRWPPISAGSQPTGSTAPRCLTTSPRW